jgi:pyruvate/2-oxoacid:ferredoxin oxidoreductase beta subunit
MRKYLLITGFTIIFAFCVTNEHVAIKSAKELKIDASEIGEGWEGYFYYMNDPSRSLKEFSEILEANKEKLKRNVKERLKEDFNEKTFQKNLEKDKAYFLELSSELEECGVKDGYFLSMKRESPKAIAEVHVFVFDDASGS